MARSEASAAVSVERFFQFSLLGLVTSGYLAVAGSGYLDAATVILTAAGLMLRGLLVWGVLRLEISERITTLAALGYIGFFGLDYWLLSRDFLNATVHLVFFLAVMKILTAHTNRDYLYTAAIAFLELLAAAILSIDLNFFFFLALYLLFAMAALTSGEIRRALHRAGSTSRCSTQPFYTRLAALSTLVTIGILALTAGLFFLLPRTAEAAFSRFISHRILLPGFSNEVTLGQIGEIKISSRTIMHIGIFKRDQPRGLKWRGGVLTQFDGKQWTNPRVSEQAIPVVNGHADLGEGRFPVPGGRRLGYHVELNSVDTNALFFAGTPEKLDLRQLFVFRSDNGTYRLGYLPPQEFGYDAYGLLEEAPEATPALASLPPLSAPMRARTLQLPSRLDPRVAALAGEMTASAANDLQRARALEQGLHRDYGYSLELPEHEPADPIADFLFTRKKGYCEHFATAMTIMLRTLGIPSRLVTGFQSGTYNPLSDLWIVRASDAHSWVEAWIPGHGWTTFDPTPPDLNPASWALLAKLGLYVDAAQTFWQDWVVTYDLSRQGTLSYRVEQSVRKLGISWFESLRGVNSDWQGAARHGLREYGPAAVAAIALGMLGWWLGPPLVRLARVRRRVNLVRRGQGSVGDATLLYQRMLHILRRRGYDKPAWFTPAEFAQSLPRTGLGMAVSEFTATYNEWRFGGRTGVSQRLSVLLDDLERQED